MSRVRNGWDTWYEHWNERFADQEDGVSDVIPYEHLSYWGEKFREVVMLNDHWIGYQHSEPMSLEDGMSIAFVLYDSGVDVDELIEVLDEFEPLEGAIARVGIPLCWLTDPLDHVQDLLDMLNDLPNLEVGLIEQLRQTLEEMLGGQPPEVDDWSALFREMSVNTASWLLELTRILGDNGRLALRAWWQGRMIVLLRESATSRKRRRRRKKDQPEVPSAFQDLIRGLDMTDLYEGDDSEKDQPEE
jgi:hypothetical protein